jgi:hypothetical protein
MPVSHDVGYMAPQSIHIQNDQGIPLNTKGSSVRFQLRDAIIVPSNVDGYIRLGSLRYSNVFYNIDNHNNLLYYSLSNDITTVHEYLLPIGNYNVNSLLTEMNASLADTYLVFAYDPMTFRISVTNSQWGFILHTGTNSIAYTLGYDTTTIQDIAVTGSSAIRLSGISEISFQVSNIGIQSNGVIGASHNILDVIPNDVILGNTKSYTSGPARQKFLNSVITFLDVTLIDESNRELEFHGSRWFASLEIIFQYKPVFQPPFSGWQGPAPEIDDYTPYPELSVPPDMIRDSNIQNQTQNG